MFFLNAGPEVERINSFMVFDRWGNLMFEKKEIAPNDPSLGWDGRFKGKILNPGTFVWTADILFIDGVSIEYSGTVSVVK